MELILSLLQQMCVYLVLAYMLSKTPVFLPLLRISHRLENKLNCYVIFSLFCVLGTYLGLQINDAIANTRAIGAVMGGLFGGPVVGFAVGLTGGIHRYTLGGLLLTHPTAIHTPCQIWRNADQRGRLRREK